MIKKTLLLLCFLPLPVMGQIDLSNKESSLPAISSGLISNISGMLEYCSAKFPSDYSRLEVTLQRYTDFHEELFSNAQIQLLEDTRSLFIRAMSLKTTEQQKSECVEFSKSFETYDSSESYYEMLGATYENLLISIEKIHNNP